MKPVRPGDVRDSSAYGAKSAGNFIDRASVERAAAIFRAPGEASRLRLLVHLLDGEHYVGDLAALEGEALSTISQRLRILRTEKSSSGAAMANM